MTEFVEQLDLSAYSIEELKALVDRARKEIVLKERNRLEEVRSQIERLAGDLNMSAEEFIHYGERRRALDPPDNAKYRNPADPSQTWSGRGKRPRWLQQALQQGARLEDFAVDR